MKKDDIKDMVVAAGLGSAAIVIVPAFIFCYFFAIYAFKGIFLYLAWNCALVPLTSLTPLTYLQSILVLFVVSILSIFD